MNNLSISENKKYLMCGGVPFFWLGDTAWLLFHKLSEKEAYSYLRNRAEKGFNVIQAVLVYSLPKFKSVNKMYISQCDVTDKKYWEHCDKIIKTAENFGLYMMLLPCWGSLVKGEAVTCENAEKYSRFLAERYKDYSNIIWALGGDMKPEGFETVYRKMGEIFKAENPDKLVTFHPFGRCISTDWFKDEDWIDFNMFQSGHRRYDQGDLGAWDDNKISDGYFGEDNWRYVEKALGLSPLKPVLDGEPSYEWILQGLHDPTQPYWQARHARRYAYWSVFAGSCGHTYGDNSVMQFYNKGEELNEGVVCYGAKEGWKTALHHEGSGQMKYLKELMTSVDFINGSPNDGIIIGGQRERLERIAVFSGKDFIFAYTWSGKPLELDLTGYGSMDAWWLTPSKGIYSYIGKTKENVFKAEPPKVFDEDRDRVLVLKKANK